MIARAGMAPETEDGRRWCPIAANSSHASKAARTAHGTVRRRLLSDGYFAGDFGSIYDHRHKPEQMAPSVAMSAGEPQKQAPTCANDAVDHCYHKLPPVPDIDGQRWCRACQVKLPVSAFPTGKRRYLCRKHLWQRCTRQRMIAVIGGIVCARRSLFSVAPADIATDRAICSGLWRWS